MAGLQFESLRLQASGSSSDNQKMHPVLSIYGALWRCIEVHTCSNFEETDSARVKFDSVSKHVSFRAISFILASSWGFHTKSLYATSGNFHVLLRRATTI